MKCSHFPFEDSSHKIRCKFQELLALQERIGNVSTGLDEETILVHMKQWKHSDIADSQVEAEPCCICQVLDQKLLHLYIIFSVIA